MGNLQTSPAKFTGTTDKQIVARIGGKRVLLTFDEEVRQSIGEIIPKKVQITFSEDKLVSYKELQDWFSKNRHVYVYQDIFNTT